MRSARQVLCTTDSTGTLESRNHAIAQSPNPWARIYQALGNTMVSLPPPTAARIITTVAAGVCLAAALSHIGSAQGSRSVVDADGFEMNGKPLTRNQNVDGMKLTGKRADEILLSCDNLLFLYVCKQERCELSACAVKNAGGIEVREWKFEASSAPKSNGLRAWLSALGKREPKPAAVAAARRLGSPVDEVILQDEKGVHWAPAFAGVLEDNFCLIVGTLPPSGQTWTTTLQWDRRRDPEALAAVPGLQPGLYSLRKGRTGAATCQPDPDEDAAWVLVAVNARFSQLNAEWRSHAAAIEELEQTGLSPTLAATLRHAVLAGLAEN